MHSRPAATVQHATPTRGHMTGWAPFYDAITWVLFLGGDSRIRGMTADLARLQPGESVLDVGCGTGTLTLVAKRRVGAGAVAGVDPAPDMVAVARRKASCASLAIDFQVGLVQALPFPDNTFDVVLGSLMLHHVPAEFRPQGFAEIRRVLKPDGRLLAVDFQSPASGGARHLTQFVLGRRMVATNLADHIPALQAAGFVQIETGPTAHWALARLSAAAGKAAAA
jgi:ubiquinone/menaquinone biosynthesis C-methylase UbiE